MTACLSSFFLETTDNSLAMRLSPKHHKMQFIMIINVSFFCEHFHCKTVILPLDVVLDIDIMMTQRQVRPWKNINCTDISYAST
jgi:hypothetical protein